MNFTCNIDILNDVKYVVVVDLPSPFGRQDMVHGAPDLACLLKCLPAFIIENMHINF